MEPARRSSFASSPHAAHSPALTRRRSQRDIHESSPGPQQPAAQGLLGLLNVATSPSRWSPLGRSPSAKAFDCPELRGYRIGRSLGNGKFGKVRSAFDRATGQTVAIKQIDKPERALELAAVQQEVEL